MDPQDILDGELNTKGAFIDSLRRNNKQIKNDRALSLFEDAEMAYKREIEDMERNIKRLGRNRENMLDLSPENTQTLKLANDFDPEAFVEEDGKISDQIRNLTIQLNIRKKRYNFLFGGDFKVSEEI